MSGPSISPASEKIPQLSAVAGQSSAEECLVRLNSESLHDLMSPANQICTMADLILKKHSAPFDSDAQVLFGFLQKAARRLQGLLVGLGTYMRVAGPRGSYRLCDANHLLAGALATIQPTLDASGGVITYDSLPQLYCDPCQMIYVFASLIENSIKFRSELRPEIHVSAISDDNACVFSVRDNGIGIDPRYRDRIFGLFKRIDAEGAGGPGVGLAIVRQIVEQHGGRIWVESEPGLGATFLFALPRDTIQA